MTSHQFKDVSKNPPSPCWITYIFRAKASNRNFHFTGIYGNLLLPVMLLTTTAKNNHLHACTRDDLANSSYLKNWSDDPTFLMQKNYSTNYAKAECMCKIYSTDRFIVFPASSLMNKKKIFRRYIQLMAKSGSSMLLCNKTVKP